MRRLLAITLAAGVTLAIGGVAASAADPATIAAQWNSGTMAPGTSKTWHWNNANPLTVSYEIFA